MTLTVKQAHQEALLHWLNARRYHKNHPASEYAIKELSDAVAALDHAKREMDDERERDEAESEASYYGDIKYHERKDEGL